MNEIVSYARPGKSYPLGATLEPNGVNFSVYSKSARRIELLFYDHVDDARPARAIQLDPRTHRTAYYWHVFVPGIRTGQIYAYRVHGPFAPHLGHRFDGTKVLLDPYGTCVLLPRHYDRAAACRPGPNDAYAAKNVVVDLGTYDWENDEPPKHSFARTIIYEMHVAGFTANINSCVAGEHRGTYAGLIEKIPYLTALGITAVELLPIFQFDADDAPVGRKNYWGYAPMNLFTPHRAYASNAADPMGPLNEFRDMVKALHRAGIEVLLDVVYNHTAEGNESGPCLSFRGFENGTYYVLERDRSRYANWSGTGNTLNASDAVVQRLISDSLRFWVEHMHVDGFRFDLASILTRDVNGHVTHYPPALWSIESNPVLARTKLIAEPWDAGGVYQVGNFPGDRWAEWNGRFRDDVRAFMKGERDTAARLPARLLASPDVYEHEEREAEQSINFVTCHDGFTLNDLVSYNEKHNESNGENNRDGSDDNHSWNCGVEGPTDDLQIEALRHRQVKNFLALTFISMGVPMLLMGDEVRRTQEGNNNAYSQNNPTSWFDWSLVDRHADILRFVQQLATWRHQLPDSDHTWTTTLAELLRQSRIDWHGVRLNEPDFGPDSHSISVTIQSPIIHLHIIVNAFWSELAFELPARPLGSPWHLFIDTGLPSPLDIFAPGDRPILETRPYTAVARSVIVLTHQE